MAKKYTDGISFASAFSPTGGQPLDNRTVVKSLSDLLSDDTFGTTKYEGMIVAVIDEKQIYMLIDANNSLKMSAWKKIGDYDNDVSNINSNMTIRKGDSDYSAVLVGEYEGHSNKAISKTSIALGAGTTAGLKGWYYDAVNFDDDEYVSFWLTDKQPSNYFGFDIKSSGTTDASFVSGYVAGDIVSIVNDSKYDKCAPIQIVTGNKISFHKNDIPFTSIKDMSSLSLDNPSAPNLDDYSIYVSTKPNAGLIDFGGGALSQGSLSKATNVCAHAEGLETHAYGQYSHTEGRENEAGYAAHAEGRGTTAKGNTSHSEGYLTNACGTASHAEGQSTTANRNRSHAEGTYSFSDGVSSHTEGYRTKTGGDSSINNLEASTDNNFGSFAHAEGNGTLAYGSSSHAEGLKSSAIGHRSHSEGNESCAQGNNSHAEGWGTKALGNSSHSEGVNTISGQYTEETAPLIHSSTTIGNFTHAEGNGTLAYGNSSHAEGIGTIANGIGSHAEGRLSYAEGEYSHAEGYDGDALGKYSHVEGYMCTAKGDRGHAEGYYTVAEKNAHSEGVHTYAAGERSHAEGSKTIAFGNYSHSEGFADIAYNDLDDASVNSLIDTWKTSKKISVAYGESSHTEGKNCYAEGNYSHSGGYISLSHGIGSFAHGNGVVANGNYSVAFGSNNTIDTTGGFVCGVYSSIDDKNKIFIVGSGTQNSPQTALSVDTSGITRVKNLQIQNIDVLPKLDYHGTLTSNNGYASINIYPYKRFFLTHSKITTINVKECAKNAEYFIVVTNPMDLSNVFKEVTLKHPYGANLLDYSSYTDGIVEINLLGIDSSTALVNSIIYK